MTDHPSPPDATELADEIRDQSLPDPNEPDRRTSEVDDVMPTEGDTTSPPESP